jgi:hypothetical protein
VLDFKSCYNDLDESLRGPNILSADKSGDDEAGEFVELRDLLAASGAATPASQKDLFVCEHTA